VSVRPNPETVALLRELTRDAEKGEIQDVFVQFRCRDGGYDHSFTTTDPADMLYELGTVILLERSAGPREGGTA